MASVEDGKGWLTFVARSEIGKMLLGAETERVEVVRYSDDALITVKPFGGLDSVFVLMDPDDAGRAQYLHNTRASSRVA